MDGLFLLLFQKAKLFRRRKQALKEISISMQIMDLVLFVLVLVSAGYGVYATYCTWAFFRTNKNPGPEVPVLPPVSVIKPVAGMEEGYLENFVSFCQQDYPVFELIFAFPPKRDALVHLLEGLKARFPQVDMKKAKHSVLVMSDSDMRVGTQYLKQTVTLFLHKRTGLVTALYRNIHSRGLWAALQALTIQSVFVPNVLFSRKVEGMSCAFGATLCTSKDILESLGGIESFLDYLADDYQMGHRIHEKGLEILLSHDLVDQVSRTRTFKQYFLQQLRAGITQRVCRPLGYLGSVLTHQVSLALLFLLVERFSPLSWVLFMTVCGIRIFSAGLLNTTTIRNRELSRYLALIPLNDLMNTLFWSLSLFTGTVRWEERKFRVFKGGKMAEFQ
jgi:ceramide glucosyltransferase